jgi:hypothetical protein
MHSLNVKSKTHKLYLVFENNTFEVIIVFSAYEFSVQI